MSRIGSNTAWCELLVAYAWLRGDGDSVALQRWVAPEGRNTMQTFAEQLKAASPRQADLRCERILAAAGISRFRSGERR